VIRTSPSTFGAGSECCDGTGWLAYRRAGPGIQIRRHGHGRAEEQSSGHHRCDRFLLSNGDGHEIDRTAASNRARNAPAGLRPGGALSCLLRRPPSLRVRQRQASSSIRGQHGPLAGRSEGQVVLIISGPVGVARAGRKCRCSNSYIRSTRQPASRCWASIVEPKSADAVGFLKTTPVSFRSFSIPTARSASCTKYRGCEHGDSRPQRQGALYPSRLQAG